MAMLIFPSSMAQTILSQAMAAHPIECCGVIAGRDGTKPPMRLLIAMRNAAAPSDFFEFAPVEQLRLWREMEARHEELLVIYHSHTRSAPYPSRTDLDYAAAYPDAFHLIIATDPRFNPALRCYRIRDGQTREVPLLCR